MASKNKDKFIEKTLKNSVDSKDRCITDRKFLGRVVKELKDTGHRIVLTQGVYDLFHVGHKRYLELAKKQGDILIVGVDSDKLTKRRKGPSRPFDNLQNRLEILASLRAVDILAVRNDKEHIYSLIKTVKPDVLIMSKTTVDFKERDRLNLLKYCGVIKVLPSQSSTSTTAKLRRMMVDGAEQLGVKIINLINDFLKGVNNESSNSISSGNSRRASKVLRKTKTRKTIHTRKKSNK